jgi:hypothetical protein
MCSYGGVKSRKVLILMAHKTCDPFIIGVFVLISPDTINIIERRKSSIGTNTNI